jgi:hypothetical protein
VGEIVGVKVDVAVGVGVCVGMAVSVNAGVGVDWGTAGVQEADANITMIRKQGILFICTPG